MSRRRYIESHVRRPIFDFNPEIKRGVIAIFLLLLAGLSVLSFFKVAGVAGTFIDDLLSLGFGVTKYAVPILLVAIAIVIEREADLLYRPTHSIGFILFFLSLNGLVHLTVPLGEQLGRAMQGLGGGLFGLALAWPLLKFLGAAGAVVVLIALFLVAILFLFNTSLASLIDAHKKIFSGLGTLGNGILQFPSFFKRGLRIKGDYNVFDAEELQEEFGEDAPEFKKHSIEDGPVEEGVAQEEPEEEEDVVKKMPRPVIRDLPSVNILGSRDSKPTAGDIKANAEIIRETLLHFGIEVDMGEIRVGPTVTQYSMKPAKGVKLSRITALANDLALALAAHPIRIEAPIPGQSYVGIEVPNQRVATVTLKELLTAKEFQKREHNMNIALGKDVAGKVWFADLTRMPHMLIAGATGSGKTVCINSIIVSLLYQNNAAMLRFIMVDPKRVELTSYNGIPHLLTPVITDVPKTVSALKWTIGEMDRRFDLLAKVGARDIASYNNKVRSLKGDEEEGVEPMPYVVFIIDELADLMAAAGAEVEAGIIRIAQMARATGIHLIVATQRPSTDVITGLIKANIPTRAAFSVASLVDSRTILDSSGAEKLLGRGDMLFISAEMSKPKRLQGALVSEEDVRHVVDYLKGDELPSYDTSILEASGAGGAFGSRQGGGRFGQTNIFGKTIGEERDPLFEDAKKLIVESGKASASFLQRRMKLGYARAARILDELESAGVVGPGEGAKPREVLARDMEDAEILEDRQYFEDDALAEDDTGFDDDAADDEQAGRGNKI